MLKSQREKKEQFDKKYRKPCAKCGETRLYLIQFHHIDPAQKSFNISYYNRIMDNDTIAKEINKCVCLCSNCHDEFHYLYGFRPKDPIASLNEYLGRDVSG